MSINCREGEFLKTIKDLRLWSENKWWPPNSNSKKICNISCKVWSSFVLLTRTLNSLPSRINWWRSLKLMYFESVSSYSRRLGYFLMIRSLFLSVFIWLWLHLFAIQQVIVHKYDFEAISQIPRSISSTWNYAMGSSESLLGIHTFPWVNLFTFWRILKTCDVWTFHIFWLPLDFRNKTCN